MGDDRSAFRAGLGAALLAFAFLACLMTLLRRAGSVAYVAGREDAYARGWTMGFAFGREEAERDHAPPVSEAEN